MNRSAKIIQAEIIFYILLVVFIGMMIFIVYHQSNGAFNWSDYYAKEIAKKINLAKPGDEIIVDIQKITEIAVQNRVSSFSEIFTFNNAEKEVCVSLYPERKTCYYFYNNVDIVNTEIELASPTNILKFKIVNPQIKNE